MTKQQGAATGPPLLPTFADRIRAKATATLTKRKTGPILEDSSWITTPSIANSNSSNTHLKDHHEKTKRKQSQLAAMKAMTNAFRESMRCPLEEAEKQTSHEDRINCIQFGKLLVALDAMRDCMKTYGMTRTARDLEYHCNSAMVLYRATPPESRDFLSCLLLLPPKLSGSDSKKEAIHSQPLVNVKSISMSPARKPSSAQANEHGSDSNSNATATANENPSPASSEPEPCTPAPKSPTPTVTTPTSPYKGGDYAPVSYSSPYLPPVGDADREKARKSMFWLCYFVRYTYNVHRLVLTVGHDAVDASPMCFLRYLHPYFGDYYYSEKDDAKGFLMLLSEYQTENFLGDANDKSRHSTDKQLRQELKLFMGVIEVVMYLWTPAFQEMALTGEQFLQNVHTYKH